MWLKTLIIASIPFVCYSQKEATLYSLGANYLAGKIWLHTPKIYPNAPPYSQALELTYAKQTTGNQAWQQRFGFPETALNFCIAAHGSRQIGTSVGLYPSIQFKVFGGKTWYGFFKVGGGIGINTVAWQRTPIADTLHNILGSKVNNFTLLQIGVRGKINTQISLQGGFHFYHVSNAATRTPNYGINTLGVFLGMHYHPNGSKYKIEKKIWKQEKNPLNIGSKIAIAFAESKTPNGPLYPYYHASIFGSKMYRNKSRILIGLDATYNSELYTFYKNSFNYQGSERSKAIIYTAFVGHEFVFGKIGLPLQLGFYLNRPAEGRRMYQKLGINYHFIRRNESIVKDVYLFTQLFTEVANAQYAEVGMGFLF